MGCGPSQPRGDAVQRRRNDEIEDTLRADNDKRAAEIKLLLLGPGESGKSTMFKQMKILQKNGGYSQQELADFTFVVYGNIITQMKVIVTVALKLRIDLERPENAARAKRIGDVPAGGDAWSAEVARDIAELWRDNGIKHVYSLRDRKYHLNESAGYFFNAIDRIAADDYLPTVEDVLRARVRTTGIQEASFEFEKLSFRLLDVGGQRSERRKWIHCFDNVTAVMFCVGLSEFDQTLREGKENRMLESLALFADVCNSRWFKNTAFVLFLNKVDLFEQKVARLDMRDFCFPEYKHGHDFAKAKEYVRERFLERNLSPHVIYPHFTVAIDTKIMSVVLGAVRETILHDVLEKSGFSV